MKKNTREALMGLWTMTHFITVIPAFIVFIALALLIARLLKNKSERIKYIPLQVIAVILLVLEVGKQIYSAWDGSYDLYSLPFHYCSLFLYLLPFHAFYRGKYSHVTDAASFGCLASLVLDMLLMPAVIYSADNVKNMFTGTYIDFHTVVFHNLVCLYFFLTLALGLYKIETKRDVKIMTVFLAIYVAVAAVLSQTLEVNFHNLYRCNIAFLEDVRLAVIAAIGGAGQLIYIAILFVLTILFAYLAYALTRGILALIGKIAKRDARV